jgi:GNAT superfamily N-acetyltransferase
VPDVVVRAAAVDDADAIGRIHVIAWQATYPGLLPQSFLDGLSIVDRQASWRHGLTQRLTDRSTLVVEDASGSVRGFTTVGDERGEAPHGPEVGELWAINLEPDAWGRGLGTALLRGAERELTARGQTSAVLWTVRGNVRARRFYEREGWALDGGVKTSTFGGTQVPEVRYRRDLNAVTDAPARD